MSNSYKFYSDTKDIMKKYVNATEGAIIYGISKSRIMVLASEAGAVYISAWDGEKLIGLINALDDGELTAYVHYLLVNPEYQKDGIGTRLVEMIKQKYKDYLCIVLTAENPGLVGYYEKLGFDVMHDAFPMKKLSK